MIKEQEPQAIRQLAGGVRKLEQGRGGSTRKEQWTVEHLEGTGPAEENTNPSVNACRERKALRGGSFSESRKSNVKRLKMPGLSRCYDSRNESIRDGRGATGGGGKSYLQKV